MTKRVFTSYENHFKGSWTGYMAPSSLADGLSPERHYSQRMLVDEKAFPANTVFEFAWPAAMVPLEGVWSYNHIAYGNLRNTLPPVAIPARRISAIEQLALRFDAAIAGHTDGFGVIIDSFLTSKPGDFRSATEIMVSLHTPPSARDWYVRGHQVGRYVGGDGVAWRVSRSRGSYTFYRDGGSLLRGEVDLRGMLRFLVSAGELTGREYYNGHGFGAEPKGLSGTLTVHALDVQYS